MARSLYQTTLESYKYWDVDSSCSFNSFLFYTSWLSHCLSIFSEDRDNNRKSITVISIYITKGNYIDWNSLFKPMFNTKEGKVKQIAFLSPNTTYVLPNCSQHYLHSWLILFIPFLDSSVLISLYKECLLCSPSHLFFIYFYHLTW